MTRLSSLTDETATLSLRSGDQRVYVDQVTPNRDVKMSVSLGLPYPLHAGASSKAFLAFLPSAERTRYLNVGRLQALTGQTQVDAKKLRKEIEHIREVGYAQSFGERMEGAGAVAAPVFGRDGEPAGVISVCGPIERFRDEADRAAELLLEHSRDASARLGYRSA